MLDDVLRQCVVIGDETVTPAFALLQLVPCLAARALRRFDRLGNAVGIFIAHQAADVLEVPALRLVAADAMVFGECAGEVVTYRNAGALFGTELGQLPPQLLEPVRFAFARRFAWGIVIHDRDRNMTESVELINVSEQESRLKQLVSDILAEARRQGADAAEVSASEEAGLSVTVRLGELETVEFNRDRGFGIAVYFGQRKGTASTSDSSPEAIADTVAAACRIARYTQDDACNGLADPELMATSLPDLDIDHPWTLDVPAAEALARACEAAARDYDRRIVNSEGASVGTQQRCQVYGNTHGFIGSVIGTRHSSSCIVIAEDASGKQRDYWYSVARDPADLEAAESIGAEAGRRTVSRLGSQRIKTGKYPVLFDPQAATSLIGHLTGALSGGALYRRASFLLNSMGTQVLPQGISVVEQPHLRKALGSAAFDADGVATYGKPFIDDGTVANYVLGTYSARKLKMRTTANAGGVHNLVIEGRVRPVEELLREMGRGLLVTELMGQGVNMVTGDYSRGIAGFWIENGTIAHPVDEVTIAANLKQMLAGIVGLGDDVDRRRNIHTGSILVESMTVAA
jgi:PmbA protein